MWCIGSGKQPDTRSHSWAISRISQLRLRSSACQSAAMLTEMYIEALLIDEDLADQVWDAWYSGLADDLTAFLAWLMIAER